MATMETRLLPEAAMEIILEYEADGNRISPKSEEAIRNKIFHEYLPFLEDIPSWFEMTDNQRAAIISFAWSTTPHFYRGIGKDYLALQKDLQYRKWDEIGDTIRFYNKDANSKVDPKLVKRRRAESRLWKTPGKNSQGAKVIVDTGNNIVYKGIPFTLWGLCTPAWEGISVNAKVNDRYFLRGKPLVDADGHWEWKDIIFNDVGTKEIRFGINRRYHRIIVEVIEPPALLLEHKARLEQNQSNGKGRDIAILSC